MQLVYDHEPPGMMSAAPFFGAAFDPGGTGRGKTFLAALDCRGVARGISFLPKGVRSSNCEPESQRATGAVNKKRDRVLGIDEVGGPDGEEGRKKP